MYDSEKIFSPAVVTSKAADKDFENIRGQHDEIIQGMAMQSMKIAANNQQKQAALQQKDTMNMEMDKAKLTANTDIQKSTMDFQLKQSELDIKRAALASS